ncbi:MAG: non-canonical purine NTP diphosphatase [Bacteroidales bacterium]|jgi:XTP/dITP diphosphohydrolase
MNLVFATNNKHKLEEIRNLIPPGIQIITLSEIGCFDIIPETAYTIEENASQKSHYIFNKFGVNCFADDTGLEIEALNGRPGVYSARYAGEDCNFEDNINRVLSEMKGAANRKARFRTVISLIIDGVETQFVGLVNGQMLSEKHGNEGFGYDPVFLPDGFSETFAEMPLKLKNSISHRGLAVQKLNDYLRTIIENK